MVILSMESMQGFRSIKHLNNYTVPFLWNNHVIRASEQQNWDSLDLEAYGSLNTC